MRVVLSQLLLLLREVVKSALVALSVTMFGAVHVAALAGRLDKSYLLAALPAFVEVSLNIIWLGLGLGLGEGLGTHTLHVER